MAAPVAVAKERKQPAYRLRYGMAGCGIGSAIVSGKGRGAQIGVWFFNELLTAISSCFSPTYSMTSGTSNCLDRAPDPDVADAVRMEQQVYIEANLAALSKDAARGSGDVLDGLGSVFGCDSPGALAQLRHVSRRDYQQIYGQGQAEAIRAAYVRSMRASTGGSKDTSGCLRLI